MQKSKLVLGTVQLGMPYGLGNTAGQPSKDEAFQILDAAFAGGINTFDTASAYGSSEEVLGAWMAARGVKKDVYIVTKVKSDKPEEIRAEIESSLKRLGIERLDGCLIHSPDSMHHADLLQTLADAKHAGLTSHIGVSVYAEEDAQKAIDVGMDYVQVPYNVFDQRLDKLDFFDRAKEKGVIVFARSPFLQGLLLRGIEATPSHLAAARPHLERFIKISRENGLSQLEAALLFALGSRAEHIIFGARSKAQVADILSIVERKEMPVDLVAEIRESFQDIDRSIIDPRLWKKQN